MHITEREAGDLGRLRELARRERDAEQRDRLRAAALTVEGFEPATGASVALQTPCVNTGTMSVYLGMLSAELEPTDHYAATEAIASAGNDDAVLRWNACVRIIDRYGRCAPDASAPGELEAFDGDVPAR